VGEALACREGLALASNSGLQSFVLATDCTNIVTIQGDGFGRYGTIILEIKPGREGFSKVEFIYEGRQSNLDAQF